MEVTVSFKKAINFQFQDSVSKAKGLLSPSHCSQNNSRNGVGVLSAGRAHRYTSLGLSQAGNTLLINVNALAADRGHGSWQSYSLEAGDAAELGLQMEPLGAEVALKNCLHRGKVHTSC